MNHLTGTGNGDRPTANESGIQKTGAKKYIFGTCYIGWNGNSHCWCANSRREMGRQVTGRRNLEERKKCGQRGEVGGRAPIAWRCRVKNMICYGIVRLGP